MDAPTKIPVAELAPPTPRAPTFAVSLPPAAQAALVLVLTFLLGMLVGSSFGRSGSQPTLPAGRLDVNRASAADLRLLPGIGDLLSQRIEEDRQKHGPFQSLDDLGRVPGVGPKTLELLKARLVVSGVGEGKLVERSPLIGTQTKKGSDLKEPIDVNEAGLTELQKLPGIGPKMAQRIVDERARKPFEKSADLRRVSGIGPKVFEKLQPYVTVGKPIVTAATRD